MAESTQTRLIRRISDGIIGWIVSERAAKQPPDFEGSVCDRIRDIARGRGWDVEREYKFSGKEIDFAFFHKRNGLPYAKAALLEVKFVSPRTDRVGDVIYDLTKLRNIDLAAFKGSASLKGRAITDSIAVRKYFMLLGTIAQVRKVLWHLDGSKETVKGTRRLWTKVFDKEGHPKGAQDSTDLGSSVGWIRFSPAFLNVDEALIVLKRSSDWHEFDPS